MALEDIGDEYQGVSNIADRMGRRKPNTEPLHGGGDGGSDGMSARFAEIDRRLIGIEGEQRTHLRWLVGIFITLVALFVGGIGLILTRVDRADDKLSRVDERIGRVETAVAGVPGEVSSELRDIVQTLSQSITAAKQSPPQILLIPAPIPPEKP
jgi:hypothetical protein